MTADDATYVFAGLHVTRRIARPSFVSAELLPDRLVTASSCLAPFVPDTWALDWAQADDDEPLAKARELGLSLDELASVQAWARDAFERGAMSWPNVLTSRDAVDELLALLPASGDWVALGLGFCREDAAAYVDLQRGRQGDAAAGVVALLDDPVGMPSGGTALGFEPLGFEIGGGSHSWLCNRVEVRAARELGIVPGPNGLLDTEADARRVVAAIADGSLGAEPVPWFACKLVEYGTR